MIKFRELRPTEPDRTADLPLPHLLDSAEGVVLNQASSPKDLNGITCRAPITARRAGAQVKRPWLAHMAGPGDVGPYR